MAYMKNDEFNLKYNRKIRHKITEYVTANNKRRSMNSFVPKYERDMFSISYCEMDFLCDDRLFTISIIDTKKKFYLFKQKIEVGYVSAYHLNLYTKEGLTGEVKVNIINVTDQILDKIFRLTGGAIKDNHFKEWCEAQYANSVFCERSRRR